MLKKIKKLDGAENDMFRIEYIASGTLSGFYHILSKISGNSVVAITTTDYKVLKDYGFDYQPLQTISLPELEAFADERLMSLCRKPCGSWLFVLPVGQMVVDAESALNEEGYTLKI